MLSKDFTPELESISGAASSHEGSDGLEWGANRKGGKGRNFIVVEPPLVVAHIQPRSPVWVEHFIGFLLDFFFLSLFLWISF